MSQTAAPEVDIEELAAARESGVHLDVGEPGEYAAGHIPGAVLIPTGQLANRMDEIHLLRGAWVRSGRPVEGGPA
ncbi:MAG: rhodanese-like domain-containing protein [Actinomycetota bacterium]|nr:rhodanese-like domain-containing protein [Actinomycetota bacterium]